MKPPRLLMTALVACSLALGGCMPSSIDLSAAETPEEISVVLGEGGYTLNPYSPVLANRRVGHLLFSGLSRIGYDMQPEPDLLSELPTKANGGISQDGMRVTYRLRDDVTWHDGRPVTAEDVAFTLGALRSGSLSDDPEVDYQNISAVSVEDSHTVSVTLREPDSPGAWRFAPFVLPAAAFAGETDIYSSPYWNAPMGSGPYRYKAGSPGTVVRLEPRDSARPPLNLTLGRTPESRRAAFDGSDASVWVDGPLSSAASESVVETPSAVWQVWLLNAGRGHETADPALRRVLAELTPVDPGVTTATADPWGAALPARSTLDTASAAAAVTKAGWLKRGITRKKGRMEADLIIGSPTLLAENDIYVIGYRDLLNEIGFRAATSVHPGWGQGGLSDDDPAPAGRYDIGRTTLVIGAPYTVGWPFDTGDVPSVRRMNGSNVTRVADKRLDTAADAVRAAGDPAEAAAGMRRLGGLLLKTDTVLWDGQLPARTLVRGVRGVQAHPLPEYGLASAPYWSIDGAPER